MAHMITEEESLAVVNKPAWHGLGKALDYAPSSEAMIEEAGLSWEVKVEPLYSADMADTGYRGIFRQDTRRCLGTVKGRYVPVQNRDMFTALDSLLSDGILKYESAGSIKAGETVWALARVPSLTADIVPGDTISSYVLATGDHNGKGAVSFLYTALRLVCGNGLTMALNTAKSITRVCHSGDVEAKMSEAMDLLANANNAFNSYVDRAKRLTEHRLEVRRLAEAVFPAKEDDTRASTRRNNILDAIDSISKRHTNTVGGIGGTAWSAVNAITEYIEHESTAKSTQFSESENRFHSNMFGAKLALKHKAYRLAEAMVGV